MTCWVEGFGWVDAREKEEKDKNHWSYIVVTSLKGVLGGGEYRNNVLFGAAMARGRLVELNGRSVGAKVGRKFGETKVVLQFLAHRVRD
jgi:hypothetical protein